MAFNEARMREIAERRRRETDAVDPERLRDHPLSKAVVAQTAMIHNSNAPAAKEYKQHAAQVVANDPDVEEHQALLIRPSEAA